MRKKRTKETQGTDKVMTKLASERVELANIKELEALVKKSKSVQSEMVNKYLDAKKLSQSGIQAAKKHLNNLKEINSEAQKLKAQAQDLGLDISKVKEWRKANDFLTSMPTKATETLIKKMQSLT